MNYYVILEILPTATTEEIRTAYRKLALKFHPDRGGDSEKFKQLSNAYQILADNNLRQKYDSSQPIDDKMLIPPLKVFAECFDQWLSQYPLIEYAFKDSCHDILALLNRSADHPMIQLILQSLTGGTKITTNDLLQTTNFFMADWFRQIYPHQNLPNLNQRTINKKLYVSLDDIYAGHRYPHHFSITNEDLTLSNDFKIINPDVQINVAIDLVAIDIEVDLHLINQKYSTSYVQNIIVQLDIITISHPNFHRIRDYDLLYYIDLTLVQLTTLKTLRVPYLNNKFLRFHNPWNANLRQLYKIEGIALPIKRERKRGNLYFWLNLVIHPSQNSLLTDDKEGNYIYTPIPVETNAILDTGNIETTEQTLPIYSLDTSISTSTSTSTSTK